MHAIRERRTFSKFCTRGFQPHTEIRLVDRCRERDDPFPAEQGPPTSRNLLPATRQARWQSRSRHHRLRLPIPPPWPTFHRHLSPHCYLNYLQSIHSITRPPSRHHSTPETQHPRAHRLKRQHPIRCNVNSAKRKSRSRSARVMSMARLHPAWASEKPMHLTHIRLRNDSMCPHLERRTLSHQRRTS